MGARRHARRITRPSERGFTLFELLVTITLIGLIASFAVLTVPSTSPDERQREEARRLLARMEFARQAAILQARSLGLAIDEDGYRFLVLVDDQWQPLRDQRGLAPRELPEGMFFEVTFEGREVTLGGGETEEEEDATKGDREENGEGEDERPRIFFLAGGEVIPRFTIRLVAEETMTEYRVHPGEREWLALSRDEL